MSLAPSLTRENPSHTFSKLQNYNLFQRARSRRRTEALFLSLQKGLHTAWMSSRPDCGHQRSARQCKGGRKASPTSSPMNFSLASRTIALRRRPAARQCEAGALGRSRMWPWEVTATSAGPRDRACLRRLPRQVRRRGRRAHSQPIPHKESGSLSAKMQILKGACFCENKNSSIY